MWLSGGLLFLTSKVRLHCDSLANFADDEDEASFPDLQGQAPLRLGGAWLAFSLIVAAFPDLQGQAPLRLLC